MKNRQRKKLIKQSILVYDWNTRPDMITLEELMYIFKEQGVIAYSSKNGGNKPFVIPKRNNKAVIFTNTYKNNE